MDEKSLKLFFLLILQIIIAQSSIYDESTVLTNYGLVKGRFYESLNGNKGFAFFNLPYALPPLNARRFEKLDIIIFNFF